MGKSLMIYPSYFDSLYSLMDEVEERMIDMELIHYASCLLDKGLHDNGELETALQKAVTAINVAHLPAARHFKKIYVCVGNEIKRDWLVSDLALKLILMNADVSNPVVAQMQIGILTAKT